MRCVGEPATGGVCVRAAVMFVALDRLLLVPMCGDCVLVTAVAATGAGVALVARALHRPGPGRPRAVIALTGST